MRALPQAMTAACSEAASPPPPSPAASPPGEELRHDSIPVRGLDRDPHLGGRLVEHLRKAFGVRAHVSLLTAQVHVAYDHTKVRLEDILAAVASLLPPPVPGEDNPRHPLDTDPLHDGVARAVGALAAVSVLTMQRLIVPQLVPAGVAGTAGTVAGVFNLIQGFPALREGLRWLLGRKRSDALTNAGAIASLTTANIPLGLVVAGLEGYVLAEEVTARRAAWRRYEDNIDTSVSALPGAVIRLEAGTRAPRDARIVEGFGTALGGEGQQSRVAPGDEVSGGALLLGGPFVLELLGGETLNQGPRPMASRHGVRHLRRFAAPVAVAGAALTAHVVILPRASRRAAVEPEAGRHRCRGARGCSPPAAPLRRPHRHRHTARPFRLPDVLLLDGAPADRRRRDRPRGSAPGRDG